MQSPNRAKPKKPEFKVGEHVTVSLSSGRVVDACTQTPGDTRLYRKSRFVCWTTSRILR
jgi:hypothetical protein